MPIIHHTVQPGDTLSAIARRYDSTVDAITRVIDNPDLILVGWTLAVPVDDTPEPPADEPDDEPAERTPVADNVGVFTLLNRHATKFGYYADALGLTPYSCLLVLDKNQGTGVSEANVDDAIGFWKAWDGPRPRMFDVQVPLGYLKTGQNPTHINAGELDDHYRRVFEKLKVLSEVVTTSDEPALIVARLGNEPELDNAPWGKMKFPEYVYGEAFNRVGAIGKQVMPDMLTNYTTNGPMAVTVDAWKKYKGDKAPYAELGDMRTVTEWGLDFIDCDVLGGDGYASTGNPAADRVRHMKMMNDLAVRLSNERGKFVHCAWPEWGIYATDHDAASGRVELQIMIEGLASQFDPGRLLFHSYFHDDARFRLEDAGNWGVDLLPEYAALIRST